MKIYTHIEENGIALLGVQGRADAETSERLGKALEDLLGQGRFRLFLDLSDVELICSAGLRVQVSGRPICRSHRDPQ